jgi:hypothetical protein
VAAELRRTLYKDLTVSQLEETKMKRFALTVFVLPLLSLAASAAIVIDNFDSGVTDIELTAGSDSQLASGAVSGDILLDSRFVELQLENNTGLTASTKANPPTGQFAWSNESGVDSIAMLTWDDNGSGLGGLDLTDSGASDAILISLVDIDLTAELTFTIEDTGGGVSILEVNGLSPGEIKFPYASFAGSADFTSVNSIKLTLDGPESVDVTLDLLETSTIIPPPITAIPEPTSILSFAGLLAVALGAVALRRRR